MNRWGFTAAIIITLLLGSGVYLVYRAGMIFVQYYTTSTLQQALYAPDTYPPQPGEVASRVARAKRAYDKAGGWQLGLLYADTLFTRAWHQPEGATADLQEALQLTNRYYPDAIKDQVSNWREILDLRLAWAYLYAGLPGRMEAWYKAAIASSPQNKPDLDLLRIGSLVSQDRIPEAEQTVTALLHGRANPVDRAVAVGAYTVLGRLDEARTQADGLEPEFGSMSSNLRWYYCYYLLGTAQYATAEPHLRSLYEESRDDPEAAYDLGLCLAGKNGIEDAEVLRLAQTAAQSTRDPRSLTGVQATLAADLYGVEPQAGLVVELMDWAREYPQDFDVQFALLSTKYAGARWQRYDINADKRTVPQTAPGLAQLPDIAAQQAKTWALADTPLRKYKVLMIAAANAALVANVRGDAQALDLATQDLRRLLGDPAVADPVMMGAVCDFEQLLLDPAFREARQGHPQFDTAVHQAIAAYLNRRRALFTGFDTGPEIK